MSSKSFKLIIIILVVAIGGLVFWNWKLTERVEHHVDENLELTNKFNARQGDLDVAKYDLITTQDSIRILRKQLIECWTQDAKFTIE